MILTAIAGESTDNYIVSPLLSWSHLVYSLSSPGSCGGCPGGWNHAGDWRGSGHCWLKCKIIWFFMPQTIKWWRYFKIWSYIVFSHSILRECHKSMWEANYSPHWLTRSTSLQLPSHRQTTLLQTTPTFLINAQQQLCYTESGNSRFRYLERLGYSFAHAYYGVMTSCDQSQIVNKREI